MVMFATLEVVDTVAIILTLLMVLQSATKSAMLMAIVEVVRACGVFLVFVGQSVAQIALQLLSARWLGVNGVTRPVACVCMMTTQLQHTPCMQIVLTVNVNCCTILFCRGRQQQIPGLNKGSQQQQLRRQLTAPGPTFFSCYAGAAFSRYSTCFDASM
eukprot:TRINITY_DN66714_c13_g1_i1.p3 TRINITY_DN66714_c13_g1~~TRINITY_DN66714_c13_g1_i1.p3  ORF type:complete len:158 (+),score=18.11 TRINITY_DN66714_c13_g1_i1:580-1053(+)